MKFRAEISGEGAGAIYEVLCLKIFTDSFL